MTVKRDFKRGVRLRQARTGESYVTARRHLMASQAALADGDEPEDTLPGSPEIHAMPPEPGGGEGGGGSGDRPGGSGDGGDDRDGSGGISVIELLDVTEEARQVGLTCRVLMFPPLVERVAPARVLRRLRDVLIATAGDRAIARLSRLALTGQVPPPRQRTEMASIDHLRQFLQRASAGLSGPLGDGCTLAFHVADGEELVPIMCTLSARDTAIELSLVGGPLPDRWADLGAGLSRVEDVSEALRRRELVEALSTDFVEQLWQLAPRRLPQPALHIVHAGPRPEGTRDPFVIGHNAEVCDLVLDDRDVSAEHAALIVRNNTYYLKDLGSAQGIVHKGMRIDNKRIVEGDVFHIGNHEIRFTYLGG